MGEEHEIREALPRGTGRFDLRPNAGSGGGVQSAGDRERKKRFNLQSFEGTGSKFLQEVTSWCLESGPHLKRIADTMVIFRCHQLCTRVFVFAPQYLPPKLACTSAVGTGRCSKLHFQLSTRCLHTDGKMLLPLVQYRRDVMKPTSGKNAPYTSVDTSPS